MATILRGPLRCCHRVTLCPGTTSMPSQPSAPSDVSWPASRRLDQPYPYRTEQPRGVAQHGEPGFRHCEEPLHGKLEVRAQPFVLSDPADREPVSAEHHGVQPPRVAIEHAERGGGRGGQCLPRLLFPAPREALL